MEFSNDVVFPAGLPQTSEVEFRPLERDYLVVLRITWLIFFGTLWLAFGLACFLTSFFSVAGIMITAGVLFILSLYTWLSFTINFHKSGYALRENDILVKRGWLVRRTRVVPMNRVQHVSIQSGPIERKYGLSSVSVYTAGTSTDISIRGIRKETAEQVREWISSRIHEQ